MKTKTYSFIFNFLLAIPFVGINAQKQDGLSKDASDEWFTTATENLIQKEYELKNTNNTSVYKTINSKNQLEFLISPEGYSVRSLKQGDPWNISFQFQGFGRAHRNCLVPGNFKSLEQNNSVVFSSPALNIEYINNLDGLRQNFIVKQKPDGEGKLKIQMGLNSPFDADVVASGKLVFYSNGNKENIKLIYDDLKVWDADGTILSSKFHLDKKARQISILVDDSHAKYPVTIDPLNRSPEWSSSADGILPALLTNLQLQVETLYGYTVAGLGDVNGDGFDDVAICAPGMADVVSGTGSLLGVGAVFIYLGSPTGLSVHPDKVLQPNTAVAGALFGFSIDAGDITGDSKNDIVIGAPMDRYQTTAQGLLGPTNVNVTAGKVYLYRSEDLFSAPNPSPFLALRLQGPNFFSTGIAGLLLSNVSVNPLFGFSVAVTKDMNGDSRSDIVIGSPAYLGINILSAQSGAAFVYYSNDLSTLSPVQLSTPTPTLLGLPALPLANTTGLLFGYSVDGVGDYNNDFYPDLVVGAPAGVNLSSLGGIFSGQFLGGSAYVYYGNGSGVSPSIGVRLQADPSGLLSNAANLFGYDVRGTRNPSDQHDGDILVSAPLGSVVSNIVNGLRLKAGQVHVFLKKTFSPSSPVLSDQALSSPRSSSILSILTGQDLNVSLLFGASMDNMLDVNCDGYRDIIVGEPLSTTVPLIGADVVGGAAFIFLGNPDGTFSPAPHWDLTSEVSPLLGVNSTALVGYSVAGARHVYGGSEGVRSLIGAPSNSLDFGIGLLNLGNTLGTTFNFVFDGNGLGKSYSFDFSPCNFTLPVELITFMGKAISKTAELKWTTEAEVNLDSYELQRSRDGIGFTTLAIVFAKNSQRNSYLFNDMNPYEGTNFYRLKIMEKDGSFNYSNIVQLNFGTVKNIQAIVAPNPVISNINIQMKGMTAGAYRIEITNAIGQAQVTKRLSITQNIQMETIMSPSSMTNGIYYLSIYDEKNTRIKSISFLVNK